MAKVITIDPGETVVIFRRNFSSVLMVFRFYAEAADGQLPNGKVKIQGSNWVFPKAPVIKPLQTDNIAQAGYWDTFFSVSVTAHKAVSITLPSTGIPGRSLLLIAGAVAAVLIASIAIVVISQ